MLELPYILLIAFVSVLLLLLALLLHEPAALFVYSYLRLLGDLSSIDMNTYLPKEKSSVQQPFKSASDNQQDRKEKSQSIDSSADALVLRMSLGGRSLMGLQWLC